MVIFVVRRYSFAFLVFLEDTAKSASYPAVLFGETVSVCMLEVFKPTSLDRCYPVDDGLEAVCITAFGVFPDVVSELLDTLV